MSHLHKAPNKAAEHPCYPLDAKSSLGQSHHHLMPLHPSHIIWRFSGTPPKIECPGMSCLDFLPMRVPKNSVNQEEMMFKAGLSRKLYGSLFLKIMWCQCVSIANTSTSTAACPPTVQPQTIQLLSRVHPTLPYINQDKSSEPPQSVLSTDDWGETLYLSYIFQYSYVHLCTVDNYLGDEL